MKEREKLIEKITKAKGYKVALFTTFNFNIDFFERTILSRLYDNNVRTVSLFVDTDEFNGALSRYKSNNLGKKYIVSPVFISGSFHPKVTLLLGEKQARLIVASSNITEAGYERNNEIYNVIDYTNEQPQYRDIIVNAIEFFRDISKLSANLDKQLMEEITFFSYYRKSLDNGERYFISSCNRSILAQIKEKIKEEVAEIKIAAPYYDGEAKALTEVVQSFNGATATLYIQQGTSTFPASFKNDYNVNVFRGFNDSKEGGNFYHGKVFLFKTSLEDYVLYGSANCTISALIKSGIDGGNIEADLLDKGAPGEFDAFFDAMDIIPGTDIKSHSLNYSNSDTSCPYRFISAEKSSEGLRCELTGLSGLELPTVMVNGVQYQVENAGDTISFFIPKEEAELLAWVFEIIVSCHKGSFRLSCWTLDRYSVASNRNAQSELDKVYTYDPYAPGAKYHEAVVNLLNAEQMCFSELEEARRRNAIRLQQKMLAEGGELEETDDGEFIVDVEFSYEDRLAFRRDEYVEGVGNRYLSWFLRPGSFISEREQAERIRSEERKQSVQTHYRSTNEDKEFVRFVKQRIRGWYDKRYLSTISAEHFLRLSREVFVEVFNEADRVKLFDVAYIVKHRISIVSALLSLDLSGMNNSGNCEQKIVIWALCVILANYNLISNRCESEERDKLNEYNRQFLLDLEVVYSIRDHLLDYICIASDKTQNDDYEIVEEFGINQACSMIDKLYGYKSKPQFEDFLKQKYGGEALVEISESSITVKATVNKIMNYQKVEEYVVNEVQTYVEYNNIMAKDFVIEVTNAVPGAYLTRITNTISLDVSRRCRKVMEYSDGRKERTF